MYLFDMDGTLIDSNDVWKDVDREFLARRGLPYTKAYYEGVAHTIFPLAGEVHQGVLSICPTARKTSWRSGWSWLRTPTPM